ncbi:hypothetical protein JMJ77_0005808, partial [Colletotrichum scovillei]
MRSVRNLFEGHFGQPRHELTACRFQAITLWLYSAIVESRAPRQLHFNVLADHLPPNRVAVSLLAPCTRRIGISSFTITL